jgi:hypothetical protein
LGGFQQNEFIVPVDDVVTDKTITYSRSVAIADPIGGWDSLVAFKSPLFNPKNDNYFDYNTYHFNSKSVLNLQNWMWGGGVNSTGQVTSTKDLVRVAGHRAGYSFHSRLLTLTLEGAPSE